jgi:pantetheine-phosphate adenylyltransferase
MSNIALYPGSFDPFTIGHLSVLEKAVKVFDKVQIAFSQNPAKKRRYDVSCSMFCLLKYLETKNFYDGKVKVFGTDDPIPARIARNHNCTHIVRGIRNNMDYNYEEGLAKFNKEVAPDIETIYFRADNDAVSSTMVYSLYKAGISIDKYLPYNPTDLRIESWDDAIRIKGYVNDYIDKTWRTDE